LDHDRLLTIEMIILHAADASLSSVDV